MPYRYNPFTSNLDFYENSSGSTGITGPTTSTQNSIVVWNSVIGAVVQDGPGTYVQGSGAIDGQGFITRRSVIGTVQVNGGESWIAPSIQLELTGSIQIEQDAELIIV